MHRLLPAVLLLDPHLLHFRAVRNQRRAVLQGHLVRWVEPPAQALRSSPAARGPRQRAPRAWMARPQHQRQRDEDGAASRHHARASDRPPSRQRPRAAGREQGGARACGGQGRRPAAADRGNGQWGGVRGTADARLHPGNGVGAERRLPQRRFAAPRAIAHSGRRRGPIACHANDEFVERQRRGHGNDQHRVTPTTALGKTLASGRMAAKRWPLRPIMRWSRITVELTARLEKDDLISADNWQLLADNFDSEVMQATADCMERFLSRCSI